MNAIEYRQWLNLISHLEVVVHTIFLEKGDSDDDYDDDDDNDDSDEV